MNIVKGLSLVEVLVRVQYFLFPVIRAENTHQCQFKIFSSKALQLSIQTTNNANTNTMNKILVSEGIVMRFLFEWGNTDSIQYYCYMGTASLVVVAATIYLVQRVTCALYKPRQSVLGLCLLMIIVIQWRYLISASLYVPKNMFAADILHSLDCDNSQKGGKQATSTRDCMAGQQTNCTLELPCTVCNPVNGMDEIAVWNWWVSNDSPCQSCNTSTPQCDSYEISGSICSKTFHGPHNKVLDPAPKGYYGKSVAPLSMRSSPIEFWRTKDTVKCTSCCQTNRTHAFTQLVLNTLGNVSETGMYRTLILPGFDRSQTNFTGDSAWLYKMVRQQFDIDPNWFEKNTKYPINSTNTSNGETGYYWRQEISRFWYSV